MDWPTNFSNQNLLVGVQNGLEKQIQSRTLTPHLQLVTEFIIVLRARWEYNVEEAFNNSSFYVSTVESSFVMLLYTFT